MIAAKRALVRMPDVTGLPFGKAKLILENAGLVVSEILFQDSYEEENTILMQRPTRGQMVYVGDKVTIGVSRESYVKWLPSIYQRSDMQGKNFVKDMLWIVQHVFGSIEEQLDVIHTFFDPYEAPESFLPWLASWTAMVLDESWPIEKKRRFIKNAIELYRIRGTVKGVKLFISMFTGHEPIIHENTWPFPGWKVGVNSEVGVNTVVLPPVNLAHAFVVEMPVSFRDLSPEALVRIHEILQLEKPAATQYYLRFAVEQKADELREFFVIGVSSGVGVSDRSREHFTSEEEYQRQMSDQAARAQVEAHKKSSFDDPFAAITRGKAPLPKAPRADNAPVEGREVRTNLAGGFEQGAREMSAVTDDQLTTPLDVDALMKEAGTTAAQEKAKAPEPAKPPEKPTTEFVAVDVPKKESKPVDPVERLKTTQFEKVEGSRPSSSPSAQGSIDDKRTTEMQKVEPPADDAKQGKSLDEDDLNDYTVETKVPEVKKSEPKKPKKDDPKDPKK